MIIRPYIQTDWPGLCAVHDAARLDELRLTVGTGAFLTLEQTWRDERLFDGQLIVAVPDGGAVAGFAAWLPDELTWLYVAPSQYRRGVGRALLDAVLREVDRDFRTEVLDGNTPALTLYLSAGFEIEKTVAGRLEGNADFAATGHVLLWPHTA